MTFIQVLADLFQLNVDCDGGVDSVRLRIPPPLDENDLASCGVPNVLEIGADGTPKPVNYELKESEGVEESPLQCSIGYAVLTLACNLWQDAAPASPLANFAKYLCRDEEAVLAALQRPWSNGPVEGHVHRLKLIKRAMYGRANFDLLRLRVINAA